MSNAERYTRVAIILHWLIAVGVLWQIAIGWSMIDIPKNPPGVRVYWFNFHKSIGLTLGMLILLRVVWRFTHGAPDDGRLGAGRCLGRQLHRQAR